MKLVNCRTGDVIAADVEVADNLWARFKGLMGKKHLPPGSALYIVPCGSIHTFFMKFNIDIAFLNRQKQVIRLEYNIPPSRVIPLVRGASGALETAGGTLAGKVEAGDVLKITNGG